MSATAKKASESRDTRRSSQRFNVAATKSVEDCTQNEVANKKTMCRANSTKQNEAKKEETKHGEYEEEEIRRPAVSEAASVANKKVTRRSVSLVTSENHPSEAATPKSKEAKSKNKATKGASSASEVVEGELQTNETNSCLKSWK